MVFYRNREMLWKEIDKTLKRYYNELSFYERSRIHEAFRYFL